MLRNCYLSSVNGQPYWIRTSGLQLRRLLLYPTELRAAVNQSQCVAGCLVRPSGIEPEHLAARDFKSLVSTYFTKVAVWWAPRESNTAPMDYESTALTNMS